MYYLVYKTTCLINNKIYVGYHSTIDINDSYLGSGTLLKKAIRKYGRENFVRDIILITESKEEAFNKEREIVNSDFIDRSDTYNLKIGGEGGFSFIRNKIMTDPEFKDKMYRKIGKTMKTLHDSGKLIGWRSLMKEKWTSPFKGKKHSIETISKMSEMKKGSLNPSSLNQMEIEKRKIDLLKTNNKRGYITILSKKWNVSHTQVRRFIKKFT